LNVHAATLYRALGAAPGDVSGRLRGARG
jgi:hypothetical protein